MKIRVLKCEKEQKLSKLISEDLFLSYNQIQKIIRNKDVKVDGKRVSKDIDLVKDCLVEVYIKEKEIRVIL